MKHIMGTHQETLNVINLKQKGSGFHESRAFLFMKYRCVGGNTR